MYVLGPDFESPGAVEIALHCAQIEDFENQGRSWWLEGGPLGDPRTQAWERRRRCYDLVLDSLAAFDVAAAKAPPTASGAPLAGAQAVRNAAYELAFATDDEIFHSVLYDWLIQQGLADELLEVSVSSYMMTSGSHYD
jgi:nuclear pore complex protein Nup155